jgi:mannosyltransferase OCH1-like enzyme
MIDYDPNYVWPLFRPKVPPQPLIPKIIHQMWLGDRAVRIDLMHAWKEKNPTWTHIFWNKSNIQDWKFRNEDKLDLMPDHSGKSDIIRYEILYHLGGVFIDPEIPAEPLDEFMFQYDCVAFLEGTEGLLGTKFLAAQPKCKLMKLCIENMTKVACPAWWYVGSGYLTHMAQTHKYPIKVYPEEKVAKPLVCRRNGVMAHYGRQIKKPATAKVSRLSSSLQPVG